MRADVGINGLSIKEELYGGSYFRTHLERANQADAAEERAEEAEELRDEAERRLQEELRRTERARQTAEKERLAAEAARHQADEQRRIVAALAAKLRELGINPEDVK